ncbi:MAG: hypothetical protein ACPGU5_03020 [Lishizhenia sp.]
MEEKVNIGIIGCGWLGLSAAKKIATIANEISCITSSHSRLDALIKNGIHPTVLDLNSNQDSDLFDWLEFKNVVLVAISPSKLEKYTETVSKIGKMLNGDQKMVFISSTSVYDDEVDIADELSPLSPSKRSGSTLINSEKELYKTLRQRLTIIRMGGLVGGERQPARYLAGKKNIKGKNHPINFIHQEDAAHLIFHVINYQIYGQIINGVAGKHPKKEAYYLFATGALRLKSVHFDYSDDTKGKTVSNYKSVQLGMVYRYSDPMKFPELIQN